jgi:hypothetical protein
MGYGYSFVEQLWVPHSSFTLWGCAMDSSRVEVRAHRFFVMCGRRSTVLSDGTWL